MRTITTILVPTDFSDSSREALDYARGVAAALGASLQLFHVVENPFLYGGVYRRGLRASSRVSRRS